MTKQNDFPAILRATRAALNLTQEQLAERLGVSFATVNRWEGGGNKPQRAAQETILALAREAGVEGAESLPPAEAAAQVTRRRSGRAAAAPTTKPMEQMLWDAACSIRGEKDAAKFKDYLLPLLFLKRLSDVFDDEIERLAEEYGDRATALEIAESDHSLLRFYLPPEARWAVISGRESFDWPLDDRGRPTAPRDIGEHLTRAVRAVVKQNPTLSGVIDVVDFAAERNGERDINPAKLKDYLLPLLFLKRLSDVFDDEIERLAEEYGDRATALEIAESDHSLLRFYLPPEARWAVISGRESFDWPLDDRGRPTAPRDIGEHLTRAVRAVVKQNPTLSGVIDVVDFAAERNGERDINPAKLRGVVETFSDPRYRLGLADVQPDFLGRAYEYLLRKFAEGSGQSAGEFFTPTEVGFLMAHILRPKPGETCHDYACGSAGLLIKLQLVARELDPTSRVPLKLSGQELQAESYAVAQMNAIIHDMEVELARGDTMINPKFREASGKIRGHDIVVANPMWNQPFAADLFANDPFDRFRTAGGITSGKGDWAWLQHTLACLDDHGRAAVVLDTGSVTRGSGSKNEDKERNIRKWFVDQDLIDGVILLPENLFYNTTAAGVIVVLHRRKPAARKGRIVLLNASRHFQKGKPKNYLPEEDIRPLAAMYLKGEPVEGELAVITTEQAREADYNLSPGRWVGQNGSAEVGSIPALIQQLEQLNAQDLNLTADLLKLLRPLSKTEGEQ